MSARKIQKPGVGRPERRIIAPRIAVGFVWLSALVLAELTVGQEAPSVGMTGRIDQLILPGSMLEAKPLTDRDAPIVVRIAGSFPHGELWRYDIEYFGLEPGQYNLVDYLQRVDGSTTDDLAAIPVTVRSILDAGQVLPNELEPWSIARLGGYRTLAVILSSLWFVGLLYLIFWRKKKAQDADRDVREMTLFDYLKARIEAGLDGTLAPSEFAELERMIFSFWRQRLGLEELDVAEARSRIKQDATAGPLLIQLERWMHDPTVDQSVDLAGLLEPYRELAYQPHSAEAEASQQKEPE